jgi:hypothetical protein
MSALKNLWLASAAVAMGASLAQAQTNATAPAAAEQYVVITADSAYWDGNSNRIVYLGHVIVVDPAKARLSCSTLTVDLPADGGQPTNIVAETGVTVDVIGEQGQTNHVTADKAVYAFSLTTNLVAAMPEAAGAHPTSVSTNEVITFLGGNPTPQVEGPQFVITGDPLVYDVGTKHFSCTNHLSMRSKPTANSGHGTNASPFNLLK